MRDIASTKYVGHLSLPLNRILECHRNLGLVLALAEHRACGAERGEPQRDRWRYSGEDFA